MSATFNRRLNRGKVLRSTASIVPHIVENYFNYFTEIEEHFQRRRGSILLLSTLDWALIETWKEAGVPLEAVLRGIDEAFDRYDKRPTKTRKVNSLAYCAQAVLSNAEEMKEAAVGASPAAKKQDDKFTPAEIAEFLNRNAGILRERVSCLPPLAQPAAIEAVGSLEELVAALKNRDVATTHPSLRLEELEQRLTVLEEKIFAALTAAQSEQDLLKVRMEVDREMAPYRGKMSASQMDQLRKQYIHKRLLERYDLPRLSLFYMH
ncbi:MAG TPA: hypothetical protein VFA71_00270 [Terriglobales bacterium]|nr:hypothetical protein [Terriglobales bacterium]